MRIFFRGLLVTVILTLTAAPGWAATDARSIGEITVLCEQLMADYAIYRDHLDADNFANTFTTDAELTVGSGTHKGREAISKYIAGQTRPANAHMFMFTTHNIQVDSETRAHGLSYALVLSGDRPVMEGDAPIQVESVGAANEYYTEFELTGEGWKITRLSLKGKFGAQR